MRHGPSGKRRGPPRFPGEAVAILVAILLAARVRPVAASPPDAAMDRLPTVRPADTGDLFPGSAFLWGDGSVMVSAAHLAGEAGQVRLVTRLRLAGPGRVIARDAVRDVAVIPAPPGFAGLRGGLSPSAGPPAPGTGVFAPGAPRGGWRAR